MSRYRQNKLKRILRELEKAEGEYYDNIERQENKDESVLEDLSKIFSEIFGEKIVFVDVTPERE